MKNNNLPNLDKRDYTCPTLLVAIPQVMIADMITEWQFNCHFRPLATVNDGTELIKTIRTLNPNFIFIDLELPNFNLMKFIEALKVLDCKPKVILYASQFRIEYNFFICNTTISNIRGFIHRNSGIQELEDCFRTVFAGRRYVSTSLGEYLDIVEKNHCITTKYIQHDLSLLTPQQKAVWNLMTQGKTENQIAIELRLKLSSVQTYKKRIRDRLDIPPHEKLTHLAIRHGIS
jgi:DNA-binding NarL/FixJ family response regulator